jgi:lipopolysaccharide transport system ATP-binding protein
MSDEILIRAENVGKKFCRNLKKSLMYGAQDIGYDLMGVDRSHAGLRKDEFWANEGVSFELRRGECLGLIGKNGAGKTTLLKMLNGLIKPDAGHIEMHGRVGAMIALGAGFNPILTGRENIYIAASVLGFSRKEVDARFDGIVDFAEISEFIDTPVQSYSSGMQVRLGFAVASSLDPDILLIDEVLAVGDVGFRTKCYNRIYEVCKNAAVIFVSHSMPQIDRLCSRALVLTGGKLIYSGKTGPSIDQYNKLFQGSGNYNWEIAEGVFIDTVKVNGEEKKNLIEVNGKDSLEFEIKGKIPYQIENLDIAISFLSKSYDLISWQNNVAAGVPIRAVNGNFYISIKIPEIMLGSGMKVMSFTMRNLDDNKILIWAHGGWDIYVRNDVFIPSPCQLNAYFSTTI